MAAASTGTIRSVRVKGVTAEECPDAGGDTNAFSGFTDGNAGFDGVHRQLRERLHVPDGFLGGAVVDQQNTLGLGWDGVRDLGKGAVSDGDGVGIADRGTGVSDLAGSCPGQEIGEMAGDALG